MPPSLESLTVTDAAAASIVSAPVRVDAPAAIASAVTVPVTSMPVEVVASLTAPPYRISTAPPDTAFK